jgi:myo-inositol-1(or 4)-monophosphatase
MDEYRHFLAIVIVEAGKLLMERFNDRHEVRYKGEINLVTEADLLSEVLIMEWIRRSFPGHDILSEESPETTHGSCFRWIIDPLDGTTNYSHGYAIFCISHRPRSGGRDSPGCRLQPDIERTVPRGERGRCLSQWKPSIGLPDGGSQQRAPRDRFPL